MPDADGNAACFEFDKGLLKATQPWTDKADLERGLELARTLLLSFEGEGADSRHR